MAKPILKYVGGKYKLSENIFKDSDFEGIIEYIEPFCGGLGSFCYVMQHFGESIQKVKLYDSNVQLIHFYLTVKDSCEELICAIQSYQKDYDATKEQYHLWRERYNQIIEEETLERACLFYVLNKTTFRGMYRVNQKGYFNVPFGNYKSFSFEPDNFRALSRLFREKNTTFEVKTFSSNDYQYEPSTTLVYLDPPYLDTFSGYQKESFDKSCHEEIKKCLTTCSCRWILSNSDSEWIRTHFECEFIQARRAINAKNPESTTQEVVARKRKQT